MMERDKRKELSSMGGKKYQAWKSSIGYIG
jgi:hypothetical protein